MSVWEMKGEEITVYTSFHTKMLQSSGNQRAVINKREVVGEIGSMWIFAKELYKLQSGPQT